VSVESIAHLSTYLAKSELMQEIGIRLASKAIDQAEVSADQMTAAMQSIDFTPGNIDISL